MPTHKQGQQIHQHSAYDSPQETMTDIRRAVRMWETLSQWEADRKDRETLERWIKDNKPNKADVTYTHDKTA